jgi:uncharacterized protein
MSNLQTVQNIYAAFGEGDIPAILAKLADNIDWEYGMKDAGVPWLQRRQGRAEVPKFFESIGVFDFQKFEPKTFLESGNIVIALIDVAFTLKTTGRSVAEENETHIWHFDSQGKVSRFAHKIDTYQHWEACRAK